MVTKPFFAFFQTSILADFEYCVDGRREVFISWTVTALVVSNPFREAACVGHTAGLHLVHFWLTTEITVLIPIVGSNDATAFELQRTDT